LLHREACLWWIAWLLDRLLDRIDWLLNRLLDRIDWLLNRLLDRIDWLLNKLLDRIARLNSWLHNWNSWLHNWITWLNWIAWLSWHRHSIWHCSESELSLVIWFWLELLMNHDCLVNFHFFLSVTVIGAAAFIMLSLAVFIEQEADD
jgi:hypothetical protein